MAAHDGITAVILAGGGGRRMFPGTGTGGDKGLVRLGGKPLIAHIADSLEHQAARVIVNANSDPALYSQFGLAVVADAEPDQGPLAGLLAAMDWIQAQRLPSRAVMSVSTDTPFLPHDLIARLSAVSAEGPAIASSLDRLHPVIGLWPLSLRDALAEALAQKRRSVEKFALRYEAIAVPFALRTIGAETVDPFFNINTPEDLALARAILSQAPV